jgi:hypothetical protein
MKAMRYVMHDKKKLKHNQHYQILINNRKIKILALSEERRFDKKRNNYVDILYIKTKIRGQEFPKHAFAPALVNDVTIGYQCT